VSERFVSGSTFKASTVEQIREAFVPIDLIREGLIVLRKVRVGEKQAEPLIDPDT
jgi:hypothetical protein